MSSELGHVAREQKREKRRIRLESKVAFQAEKFISEIWVAPQTTAECTKVQYPQIEKQLAEKFRSQQEYLLSRVAFTRFIQDLNVGRDDPYPEPSIPYRLLRKDPVKKLDWLREGQKVTNLANEAINHWSKHDNYTPEETLGWTLFSAVVWGGLNDLEALNDFLRALISKRPIYRLANDVMVLHLDAQDSSYGNCFEEKKDSSFDVTRSYTFVLDAMTRCWLVRLKSNVFELGVIDNIESLLAKVLEQLEPEANFTNQGAIAKFLKYASYHWEQLPNVQIDQAIVQVMTNKQLSCSLHAQDFSQFYAPQLVQAPKTQLKISELLKGVVPVIERTTDSPLDLEQARPITRAIRQALILTPITKAAKALENLSDSYEFSNIIRLVEWIRDLLLAEHSDKLRISSINRYMGIANLWLLITNETDVNQYDELDYEGVYQQIIDKSSIQGRAYNAYLLHRFHEFQRRKYKAPRAKIALVKGLHICRARMIGPTVYHSMLSLLDSMSDVGDRDKKTCRLILIIAYRTGMRREEIVKLQYKDIERGKELSFIIRASYTGKLKTASAFRRIPVWALLKEDELALLRDYLTSNVKKTNLNTVVFTVSDAPHKLPSEFPSRLFNVLLNNILIDNNYSLHSFRHTTLSNLALILSGRQELISDLTDYSPTEIDRIRNALLGREHNGQDRWFALAQVAGHLTPDHTFMRYIHVAQLMGSYEVSQSDVVMPFSVVHNITGYSSRKIVRHDSDFFRNNWRSIPMKNIQSLLAQDLSPVAYKKSDALIFEEDHRENLEQSYSIFEVDQMFQQFPNSSIGSIKIHDVYEILCSVQKGEPEEIVAAQWNLPEDLVLLWVKRAKELAQRKTKTGSFRLFEKARIAQNEFVPTYPTGHEEQNLLKYFFEEAPKLRHDIKEDFYKFLKIFFSKVTVTKSELQFKPKDLEHLKHFFEVGKLLIRASDWRISAPGHDEAKELKDVLYLANNFSMNVRWKDYYGYSLSIKKPKSKTTIRKTDKQKNNSSPLLKFACHLYAIADLEYPISDFDPLLDGDD